MAFTRKFTPIALKAGNEGGEVGSEANSGISLPDAYVCLAMTGMISSKKALDDVLGFLELSNAHELKTAVEEITCALGTPNKDGYGNLTGGCSLNSIWLNPEKTELLQQEDEQLAEDLRSAFSASVFLEVLTSDKAAQYIRSNAPEGMPAPEIKLDDNDSAAIAVMSSFWCMDYFDEYMREHFKKQCDSGIHKMDFFSNGRISKTDYIEKTQFGTIRKGNGYIGSSLDINNLDMAFFLPNDKNASPSSILNDALNENHSEERRDDSFEIFEVTISAPYFSLNNEMRLSDVDLSKMLPIICKGGMGERLAKAKSAPELHLKDMLQFSSMKFDYNGFCSRSAAMALGEKLSGHGHYKKFNLILDHPYLFEVRKTIRVKDSANGSVSDYIRLPIVIGEIFNPGI